MSPSTSHSSGSGLWDVRVEFRISTRPGKQEYRDYRLIDRWEIADDLLRMTSGQDQFVVPLSGVLFFEVSPSTTALHLEAEG
jgi:hypothetical protein